MICLALFPACQEGIIEQPQTTSWNLSGVWDVHFVRYDDVVIDSTLVALWQTDANVLFLEVIEGVPPETVATGTIVADTIMCSDMYQVGISRVFIDDEDKMHSGIPALEPLKYLEFVSQ